MYTIHEDTDRIAFEFSSEPGHIDRVILRAESFLDRFEAAGSRDFALVLRELLNNALEHGNRGRRDKSIFAAIRRMRGTLFMIRVHDQGDGFDHQAMDLAIPDDPFQTRSRGLPLVNAYAEKLEFNEAGNEVTAYMDLRGETAFRVSPGDEGCTITPSGSLSASNAETFRKTLSGLLASENAAFTFDFSLVPDIDSVSLSVMIGFAKSLARSRPDVVPSIVNASRDIVDLLHMTAMDRIFTVRPREAA